MHGGEADVAARVMEAVAVVRFWHVLCHESHLTLNNRMKTKEDSGDEGEHPCITMAPLLALAVSIHASKHGKPSRQHLPRSDGRRRGQEIEEEEKEKKKNIKVLVFDLTGIQTPKSRVDKISLCAR